MNNKSKILELINDYCSLKNSISKLRWHIANKTNLYENLKDKELTADVLGELFDDSIASLKEGLCSKDQIIKESKDQIIFPLEVKSGIYCLIQDDEIVYTGSAKNLLNRFSGHIYKTKIFNRIWYKYFDESEIRNIEGIYIWHLKYPRENKNAGENNYLIQELLKRAKINSSY